jgi:hypothetical protein
VDEAAICITTRVCSDSTSCVEGFEGDIGFWYLVKERGKPPDPLVPSRHFQGCWKITTNPTIAARAVRNPRLAVLFHRSTARYLDLSHDDEIDMALNVILFRRNSRSVDRVLPLQLFRLQHR